MAAKRRIARTQEGLNEEWAKYDKERAQLTDEQKQFKQTRDEFNKRIKDEEKNLKKRMKTCDEKEKKIVTLEKQIEAKQDNFQKTKQRVLRESKRIEKTKKELDSRKSELDATQAKFEKQKKSIKRTKDECQRAQKTFLLKIEPWQKKLVKLRKLKEDVRKETLDSRLQYENEFEEKLAKWVNQWELKNEELLTREETLQKDAASLLDREDDLKSWRSEMEAFQEKLNEQQEYIKQCRIDERESELEKKTKELAKEEQDFQERQAKLGEWEKTQIEKMRKYEENLSALLEREKRVEQIQMECETKDSLRARHEKEFQERETKFLEVVNTFTTERGRFEGEKKEFHRWRRKEKRKIEDGSKSVSKNLKKVELDLAELEERKSKWLESAKRQIRIDQQRRELEFLKKMKRQETQSDTKIKLKEKQMEAEMKRNVKKARQALQRSPEPLLTNLHEIEDKILEKEGELKQLEIQLSTKQQELEEATRDLTRVETLDEDKIKTSVESRLLEQKQDWETEREIERAEEEARFKQKEKALREELEIEMYANMDEERMTMEDEIRNGIAEKLQIQTGLLDEYLDKDTFSATESQVRLLARKVLLQQVHTQLWLDQQRSEIQKQRKDLEAYSEKVKVKMSHSVDMITAKEKKLVEKEKSLRAQKEELEELKRDINRAKKDIVMMKGSGKLAAPGGGFGDTHSVKSYTGGGRKHRAQNRKSSVGGRSRKKSASRSRRSGSEENARSTSRGGRSPTRKRYRKPDVLETCTVCGEKYMTSAMRDHMVKHATKIKPNLYLGNCENAHDIKGLKKIGITHILNCAREIRPRGEESEFVYKQLDLVDKSHQDITHVFDEALEFMFDAVNGGGKLFVHCQQGVSRSASFCCAFFMKRDKISLDSALALLCCKRHIVQPNSGFLRQLREFEATVLKGKR